jgi:hypothetical protein
MDQCKGCIGLWGELVGEKTTVFSLTKQIKELKRELVSYGGVMHQYICSKCGHDCSTDGCGFIYAFNKVQECEHCEVARCLTSFYEPILCNEERKHEEGVTLEAAPNS